MGRIVVGEFGQREEVCPVVLVVVDVESKICFDNLVDAFGLTVCLRMISPRQVLSDAEALGQ